MSWLIDVLGGTSDNISCDVDDVKMFLFPEYPKM